MVLKGVLFDWRGTLFHDISHEDWVRASATSIERKLADTEIRQINEAIARALDDPAFKAAKVNARMNPHPALPKYEAKWVVINIANQANSIGMAFCATNQSYYPCPLHVALMWRSL